MENSELITKAIRYINKEKKNSDISIEDVAVSAGFSTDYFNRLFLAHTGFNVMEYILFTRLKSAALDLRMSDKSILDVALDCGYASHESFSRAFRKQYGMSPKEYRSRYEKSECLYGEFHNETLIARLRHEYGQLKIADPDEIREFLLEKNALKWGYEAVTTKVNGGAGVYIGEDFRDGFVWLYEIDNKLWGEIICDDCDLIAAYLKIFSDDRFGLSVYSLDDGETVKAALRDRGIDVKEMTCYEEYVYTGEPYELTAPEGITARELVYGDARLIASFNSAKGYDPRLTEFMKRQLYKRDVLGGDDPGYILFGLFSGKELIGLSMGALQGTNGFILNNCVSTDLLNDRYKKDDIYIYAFKCVTNAVLERGVLPFDDSQTPSYTAGHKNGNFNSSDLGYRLINKRFQLKYTIR